MDEYLASNIALQHYITVISYPSPRSIWSGLRSWSIPSLNQHKTGDRRKTAQLLAVRGKRKKFDSELGGVGHRYEIKGRIFAGERGGVTDAPLMGPSIGPDSKQMASRGAEKGET